MVGIDGSRGDDAILIAGVFCSAAGEPGGDACIVARVVNRFPNGPERLMLMMVSYPCGFISTRKRGHLFLMVA